VEEDRRKGRERKRSRSRARRGLQSLAALMRTPSHHEQGEGRRKRIGCLRMPTSLLLQSSHLKQVPKKTGEACRPDAVDGGKKKKGKRKEGMDRKDTRIFPLSPPPEVSAPSDSTTDAGKEGKKKAASHLQQLLFLRATGWGRKKPSS